jgi:uncharacterized repeat protein (TIGR03943 family)
VVVVVNRRTESLLLGAMGVVALVLSAGGDALVFVRPTLVPYLFASGVVLVLLALAPAAGHLRESHAEDRAEHEHRHSRRAPWLVLAPVLVLLVVAPGPLGASAATSAQRAVTPPEGAYPPVGAKVGGAVPMTLAEYTSRAVDDTAHSLAGVPVRLTGFVAKDPDSADGKGFLLSRFTIFCCAADAEIQQVRVRGSTGSLATNSWVTVVGTWPPASAPAAGADPDKAPLPVLQATSVSQVKRPHAPYEYTLQYAD